MKVLICGGRRFAFVSDHKTYLETEEVKRAQKEYTFLLKTLDDLFQYELPSLVISGGATGADTAGEMWAVRNKVPVKRFPADWAKHGKSAGSIRNQQMLFEAQPDLVIAFPGGAGTEDMVRKAKRAGVTVKRITYGENL